MMNGKYHSEQHLTEIVELNRQISKVIEYIDQTRRYHGDSVQLDTLAYIMNSLRRSSSRLSDVLMNTRSSVDSFSIIPEIVRSIEIIHNIRDKILDKHSINEFPNFQIDLTIAAKSLDYASNILIYHDDISQMIQSEELRKIWKDLGNTPYIQNDVIIPEILKLIDEKYLKSGRSELIQCLREFLMYPTGDSRVSCISMNALYSCFYPDYGKLIRFFCLDYGGIPGFLSHGYAANILRSTEKKAREMDETITMKGRQLIILRISGNSNTTISGSVLRDINGIDDHVYNKRYNCLYDNLTEDTKKAIDLLYEVNDVNSTVISERLPDILEYAHIMFEDPVILPPIKFNIDTLTKSCTSREFSNVNQGIDLLL